MTKKLVICVLTYNRDEVIRTFLDKEIEIFRQNQSDIIIYDSSESDKTEKVVRLYQSQGYDNLFYEKIDSSVPSNVKFFNVAENIGDEYEYVWLSHDHTVFDSGSLEYILNCVDKKPDFMYLRKQCAGYGCIKEDNLNEFAMKAAWQLGRFGAAILRNDTFLKQIDWVKMSEKYLTDKRLRFSQIGLYLERLSEMDNPCIFTLEFPREAFYDLFRFQKASWDSETVKICLESWGEVISALSEYIYDKSSLIQTIDKYFLSRSKLIELKKEGYYDLSSYFRYNKWIRMIMPEMQRDFFAVAVFPCALLQKIYSRDIVVKVKKARKNGRNICIYGAGKHGIECADYLKSHNIKAEAVLVTDTKGNPDVICSIPVYCAAEYLKKNPSFVIIAMAKEYQAEVTQYLGTFHNVEYMCISY